MIESDKSAFNSSTSLFFPSSSSFSSPSNHSNISVWVSVCVFVFSYSTFYICLCNDENRNQTISISYGMLFFIYSASNPSNSHKHTCVHYNCASSIGIVNKKNRKWKSCESRILGSNKKVFLICVTFQSHQRQRDCHRCHRRWANSFNFFVPIM